MKKIFGILIIVSVLLSSIFCVNANAAYNDVMESLGLYSDCLLLVSADNSEVIFEKNAGKQTAPASLTKVVTAIVVLENCPDLNALVTVNESCIKELSGTGSSLGGLMAGEQMSVYDLLCCLLLKSANEAATALADHVSGGDRAKFISMMNETAQKLGCDNSHFVNPHGLDDEDQYVTARDMAKFILHAMEFPAFEEITGRSTYTLAKTNLQEERKLYSTNFMLNNAYKDYYCKYVKGGKTGSTSTAGRCMVAFASHDGYNYIAVALNSPFYDVDNDGVNENGAFLDCKEMFEWAYKNIELVAIADTTQIVGQVPVKYAKDTDYITLSPAETVYSLVPEGTQSTGLLVEPIEGTLPKSLKAPVKKGEVICRAKVMYAGQVIKEIDLVANMDVRMSVFSFIGSTAKSIFSHWIVKILAIAVIIALIVLIVLRLRREKAPTVGGKNYRVLNYNDFMHMR